MSTERTAITPDFEGFATRAAEMLAMPLDPDWIMPIVANLRVLHTAAELVGGLPLPDEAEAAPIFAA